MAAKYKSSGFDTVDVLDQTLEQGKDENEISVESVEIVTVANSKEALKPGDGGGERPRNYRRVQMVGIKMYDILFSAYILAVAAYSVKISAVDCAKQNGTSDESGNLSFITWGSSEVQVLGYSRWTMQVTDLLTIVTVCHVVYAIISLVSDFLYFRLTGFSGAVANDRYITVISVQRLYFCVISTLDTFLLVSTTNILIVITTFIVALIVIINLIVISDTFLINNAVSDVFKAGAVFSSPARHVAIVVANLVVGVTNIVASARTKWTMVSVPGLVLCLISSVMCVMVVYDNTCRRGKDKMDPLVAFFMSITSSNTLGLLVLGNILQKVTDNCL